MLKLLGYLVVYVCVTGYGYPQIALAPETEYPYFKERYCKGNYSK